VTQSDSIFTHIGPGLHEVRAGKAPAPCFTKPVTVDSSAQPCPGGCSAHFVVYPSNDHNPNWYLLDQSTGTGPLHYYWSWGDYSYADTIATPNHYYLYIDTTYFDICLTISDGAGCYSTYCDSFYIANQEIVMNVVTTLGLPVVQEERSVELYPNPSTGTWQLTVDNELVGSVMEVFDEQGRMVFHSKLETQNSKLELSVASGVYYLRISNEKVSVVKKLVKM